MRSSHMLVASTLLAAIAPAQTTWFVNRATGLDTNSGSSGSPFLTINHAAAVATAGDVIRIAAGSYGDEQGNIVLGTKTLTLVGAGVGSTIIQAHSSSDVLLPAVTLLSPPIEAHRPVITLNGTARVDVRDLTLDQGFHMPATGRGMCLWIGGGADCRLDHVELKNARTNPVNGIQGPIALFSRGDNATDPNLVTLNDCYVHDYGKGGVIANFNTVLSMDDCRVVGSGHVPLGGAAQNAIQISRGASGDIRRTQVNHSWYEPGTIDPVNEPTATGILCFDPGAAVTIEDCDFGNCQAGIYLFASVPITVAGSIRRNVVHASQYGMTMSNVSGCTIAENSFHATLAGDISDAWDDATPPNAWSDNHYSAIATPAPYAIDGGTAVDATAKPALRDFVGAGFVTALPSGTTPLDLVVTNLDGDTDPDWATMCQGSSNSLVVGLNVGGIFTTTVLNFGSPATSTPMALIAGEFNGAAGRDLAVVTQNVPPTLTENKVYVFANNGSGAFTLLHTQTLAGATSPNGIAAGDVNGDGKDDLVVTDAGALLSPGTASVLRNNGTGTGFTASLLPGTFTVACRDAAIARLDAGPTADIAVGEGDGANGRVHLFAGDGLGGFTSLGSPIATAVNVNGLLATDLDGDGDQDLLVACSRDAFGFGTGAVDVLDNQGTGTFAFSEYRTERGPRAMAAGDLGSDADPDTQRRDVAITDVNGGAVTIAGTWRAGAGFGTGGIAATGTLATGVGLADVNGDGYGDLVWCDAALGRVTWLPGAIDARTDFYGAGCAGTSGRVPHLTAVGLPPLPTQPNPTFGLAMSNARPFSVAVFAVSGAALPPATCSLLIASVDQTWIAVTNAVGAATVAVPVPASPSFLGVAVYLQGGVFDPNAGDSFLPGLALTQGMKLRIGN